MNHAWRQAHQGGQTPQVMRYSLRPALALCVVVMVMMVVMVCCQHYLRLRHGRSRNTEDNNEPEHNLLHA